MKRDYFLEFSKFLAKNKEHLPYTNIAKSVQNDGITHIFWTHNGLHLLLIVEPLCDRVECVVCGGIFRLSIYSSQIKEYTPKTLFDTLEKRYTSLVNDINEKITSLQRQISSARLCSRLKMAKIVVSNERY